MITKYVCRICPHNDPAYGECKLEYANYNGDPVAPTFCPFTGDNHVKWERVEK